MKLSVNGARERDHAPWAALALLALMGPIFFRLQITHDAAWQMWIGRQLVHGADLYSDIVEINPPLWFWLAGALSSVGEALGTDGLDVLVAFFLASILASLFLTDRLLKHEPRWRRTAILGALVVAALPPANFGQRELFTLIAVTPYVILAGRRDSGSTVPPLFSILVGCVAAAGLALKPHFVFVPIVLELWLRRPILRPETVSLAACAVGYLFATILLEPDYFTTALPLAQRAYGEFGNFQPRLLLPTAAAIGVAFLARPPSRGIAGACLVAALAFYLVFVVQQKGFAYHAIPAMGLLVLALVASLEKGATVRNALAFAACLLALTPNLKPYRTLPWADVPAHSSFAALSLAPRAGWPLVEERHLTWPIRSMSLWMATAVGHEIRAGVVHDLLCNPPTYLLVDDREVDFSRMFADVLVNYVPIDRGRQLTLMRLARRPKRPAHCRSIH